MLSNEALTGFWSLARVRGVALASIEVAHSQYVVSVVDRARDSYLLSAMVLLALWRRSIVFWTSSMLFESLLRLISRSWSF